MTACLSHADSSLTCGLRFNNFIKMATEIVKQKEAKDWIAAAYILLQAVIPPTDTIHFTSAFMIHHLRIHFLSAFFVRNSMLVEFQALLWDPERHLDCLT